MQLSRPTRLLAACFAVAQLTATLTGQQALGVPSRTQPRYRVVDTGSVGGPNSHMSVGPRVLTNSGLFTSYSDTAMTDTYSPDACWDGDCLVAHVARWKNGELTDLGVLGGGPNSESNWISPNGLIAGDSQDGFLDPLTGFWEIRAALWTQHSLIDIGTLYGGSNLALVQGKKSLARIRAGGGGNWRSPR